MHLLEALYILCVLLTVITLAFAAGRVYPTRLKKCKVESERVAWRVRRGASFLIASWLLSYVLYLPVMFLELPEDLVAEVNISITYFVILTVSIVSLWSVNEFLQFKSNTWDWLPWVVVPEVSTMLLCAFHPTLLTKNIYFFSVVGVTIYGVCYFYRRYQRYKRLLREEYSDLTNRELRWVWGVCIVMAIQSLSFVTICIWDCIELEFIGMLIVVICSTLVAKCAFVTEPISKSIIEQAAVEEHLMTDEERMPDPIQPEAPCELAESASAPDTTPSAGPVSAPAQTDATSAASTSATTQTAASTDGAEVQAEDAQQQSVNPVAVEDATDDSRQKVYAVIRQKLKVHCEGEKAFLDPELTREMLCSIISVNRTYLSDYLRNEGTTYYNYINTLRINYAVEILRETPNLPLVDVSYRSGYSNPATFRRAFRDIMGCLPSEYVEGKA